MLKELKQQRKGRTPKATSRKNNLQVSYFNNSRFDGQQDLVQIKKGFRSPGKTGFRHQNIYASLLEFQHLKTCVDKVYAYLVKHGQLKEISGVDKK